MANIVVLGSGMVGSAMVLDLSKKNTVTVADINEQSLNELKKKNGKVNIKKLDVTDKKELSALVKPFDLVVGAVPGFLGFETLKTIIESKKNVVDISFFPENSLELDDLAKKNKVTALVDFGVAPGIPNLMLGYYDTLMEVDHFYYAVGGLPKVRKWPFQYKAPFSPIDVIEEYTRPARYIESGQLVTKPAMSDTELVHYDKVGTLEAFNTDGLRSLLFTMKHIPNMKEKTLRYPGHIEYIKALKESGFFSIDSINVDGQNIRPIDATAKILFNDWHLSPEEEEFTVMNIDILGKKNGKDKRVSYLLYDEYDSNSKISSMARTTGYTATAAANLMLQGKYQQKGIIPPEILGKEKICFDYILKYLEERGIVYQQVS